MPCRTWLHPIRRKDNSSKNHSSSSSVTPLHISSSCVIKNIHCILTVSPDNGNVNTEIVLSLEMHIFLKVVIGWVLDFKNSVQKMMYVFQWEGLGRLKVSRDRRNWLDPHYMEVGTNDGFILMLSICLFSCSFARPGFSTHRIFADWMVRNGLDGRNDGRLETARTRIITWTHRATDHCIRL